MKEIPKIVLFIEGGLIQGVSATTPVEILVIDNDDDGAPEEDTHAIVNPAGKDDGRAYLSHWTPGETCNSADPKNVECYWEQAKAVGVV